MDPVPKIPNPEELSRKRKRIDEFFAPQRKLPTQLTPPKTENEPCNTPSSALTKPKSFSETLVPGLEIHENFITPEEERSLLSFFYSPKCAWRTDLNRRCMHFGGTYCLYTRPLPKKNTETPSSIKAASKPEILQAPPMPSELDWILDRFVSRGIFKENEVPQYCIVNEYILSQGISPHVENFQFGEPVVGLSLLSPIDMRFHELTKADGGSVRSGKAAMAEKTGRKEDVWLKGRSLCVMRGESRWKWQHEIRRVAKGRGRGWKRVSLTFRWKKDGS
jgi:alkylated DNA repair dioxygenase AlkB